MNDSLEERLHNVVAQFREWTSKPVLLMTSVVSQNIKMMMKTRI